MTGLSPLESLVRLADRLKVSDLGTRSQKVSFLMTLYPDGRPPQLKDIREPGTTPIRVDLPTFSSSRSGGRIQPNFLWDNAEYSLGVNERWLKGEEDSQQIAKRKQKWQAFRNKHLQWFGDCSDPALGVFRDFLDNWDPEQYREIILQTDKALFRGNIIFEVLGTGRLHDLESSRKVWKQVFGDANSQIYGNCSVTGSKVLLAVEHSPVKDLPGAQPTAKLVSFNEAVFESYGFRRNANAPLGIEVVDRYGKALNSLLASGSQRKIVLGNRAILFWVEGNDPAKSEALFRHMFDPQPDQSDDETLTTAWRDAIRELLRGTISAETFRQRIREDLDLASTTLCILMLSGESGRVALRDWDTDTLSRKLEALACHYNECWIRPNRFADRPPSIQRLLMAAQSANLGKTKDPGVVHLSDALLQAMLHPGRSYPWSLLNMIIRSIRADHTITDYRCAMIRGILVRDSRVQQQQERHIPMSLDRTHDCPAYLLGRLFSVLEQVQNRALGNTNSTIRDSFFAGASATPATVFPVLINKSQHHIGQLRKEGKEVFFERLMGEIMDLLPPVFPQTQSVQEQGTFVIGYYHQRQSFFSPTQQDTQV